MNRTTTHMMEDGAAASASPSSASCSLLPSSASPSSASAGDAAAAATPFILHSTDAVSDGIIPSLLHVIESSSSAAAAPVAHSFRSFVSIVQQYGLSVVRSPGYDVATLQRIARESLVCEEQLATGCYLIQAAAIVQCWQMENNRAPRNNDSEVIAYGTEQQQQQQQQCESKLMS